MKISDIFKREAALPSIVPKPFGERETTKLLFPVETSDSGDFRVNTEKKEIKSPIREKAIRLPGMDECNCQDILDIDPRTDFSDSQRQNMLGDKYSNQVAHRVVLDKILKLMNEPDDVKRVGNVKNYLSQIKMKSQTVEPSARFKQHLDHHLFNAGLDESYLGYKKEDLGGLHARTQGEAQQAQTQARFPTNYNDENCGVCRQYVDSINNKASKHKERVKNAIMMGTAATPEDAERSASSIVGDMFDDFQKGEMHKNDKSPEFKDARKIFDNYNKHLEEAHDDSLVNPDTRKNIPVVRMGKEDVAKYDGRNPLINRLYDTLTRRLSTGWSVKRREDFPSKQLRWDAQSGDNMYTEDMTDKQREQLAKELIDKGEANRYKLPSTIKPRIILYPSIPYTDQEIKRDWENQEKGLPWGLPARPPQKRRDPGGNGRSVTELPWATLNVVPRQEKLIPWAGGSGYMAETKGGFFTKDRVFKHVHQYDRELDSRLKKGEPSGMVPDIHNYLFQRALMKPNTSGMEKYNEDLLRHLSQSEHKLIPTGETEEREEKLTTQIPINHVVKLPAGKRLQDIDIASDPDSLSFEPYDTAYAKHKDELKEFEEKTHKKEPNVSTALKEIENFRKEWKNTHQGVGIYNSTDLNIHSVDKVIDDLKKSFDDEGAKHLDAKKNRRFDDAQYHQNNFIGINKTIEKLKSLQLSKEVPDLDEFGNQKTRNVVVPKYNKVPIPKKERIPKPTLGEKINAQIDYQKSFESALSKVYKGMDRKEALEKLQADHAAAVENSRPSVPFVQAKKVNTMSKKFNSKIDKLQNHNSSAASTINILSATINGTKSGALGCTDCGRSKGKSDGKCPGKGSINCRASVLEKMRGNAAESAAPMGNPSGPQ